jgi:ABC-type Co2+ transport system permease subunit
MKRRIKRITPLQAGKMLGILYGCMGLIFLPIFALAGVAGAFAQTAQQNQAGAHPPAAILGGMMLGFGIMLPVFYAVFGFIFGIISAAIYNLIARWIGGIEVEVE